MAILRYKIHRLNHFTTIRETTSFADIEHIVKGDVVVMHKNRH